MTMIAGYLNCSSLPSLSAAIAALINRDTDASRVHDSMDLSPGRRPCRGSQAWASCDRQPAPPRPHRWHHRRRQWLTRRASAGFVASERPRQPRRSPVAATRSAREGSSGSAFAELHEEGADERSGGATDLHHERHADRLQHLRRRFICKGRRVASTASNPRFTFSPPVAVANRLVQAGQFFGVFYHRRCGSARTSFSLAIRSR